MKFIIIEDDAFFGRKLKAIISDYFNDVDIDIYTTVDDDIHIDDYDVFFLDLEIGQDNGYDFANIINETTEYHKIIIFVTSHVELWKNSFVHRPFWFIDKACYQDELPEMLKALQTKLNKDHAYIEVEYDGVFAHIELKDIHYFYKDGNYVYIHTTNHEYKIYTALKTLIKKIDSQDFIKVNSGTLVKKNYILHYNNKTNEVVLKNNKVFVVSRSCRKNMKGKSSYA